ncbi:YegS/Rv2252/BmrU family lipid kinase [Petrocella sp. FN5]|uniref:YegS/Rv2252/BmrU family lipid kinase n=1 Tax=Petrocella sp. FN5 TaxID=3032002 RepID=UPI0023DBE9A6|nr:YegS/Rv2252/BmrU family lipid kinase [Petrocella sp. FN5]MDF1616699.1 YegS/Rv2252/BmrU family lipid kinase [Petrocella sp. FN5]
MSYVQLIYNPNSGQKLFSVHIDTFLACFQEKGFEVRVHRTSIEDNLEKILNINKLKDCVALIVAGGDGTVNGVVQVMMEQKIDIPLGVIPVGTANDFAKHLGMSTDIAKAIEMLSKMQISQVDVGKVNNRYFVNVCCGGLFTNISQNIDVELKNTIGKLAYYIKGVQQLPGFKKLRFKIQHDQGEIDDLFYLFLVLNGSSAGGFSKLGQNANISDGLMDFVGIKACPLADMPGLFGKILIGDHLKDKNVISFQSKHISIECLEGVEGFEESDIDGEAGPHFPLVIEVMHKRLNVIK